MPGLIYASSLISLGATGGVAGAVSNISGGAPVSGGYVQLLRAGVQVDITVPDGSGIYAFASVQVNDEVMIHPKGGWCIADNGRFTVSPGATQDFLLQTGTQAEGFWFDDFQSYDLDSDFTDPVAGVGKFFRGNGTSGGNLGGHDGNQTWGSPDAVLLGADGPSGSKTMQYNWAARPTCPSGCALCSRTCAMHARFNYLPAFGDELWFSTYEMFSSAWKAGANICTASTREYKHMIFDMVAPPYTLTENLWCELDDPGGGATSSDNLWQRMKMTRGGGTLVATTDLGDGDVFLGSGFVGQFHRWVFSITGILGSTQTATFYVDGVQTCQLADIAWLTQDYTNAGIVIGVQMGANINNGPTDPQTRSFREYSFTPTRPNMLNLLSV